MKNRYKAIMGFFLGLTALGANAELLPDGMVWQQDSYQRVANEKGEYSNELVCSSFLQAEGDTIVGGETYKKIYKRTYRHNPQILLKNGCRPCLYTLMREDDGKIYFIENEGDTEGRLLFDFNLGVGDEVESWAFRSFEDSYSSPQNKYRRVGLSKTAVLSEGSTYEVIKVGVYDISTGMFVMDEYWVDGIGLSIGCMFGPDYLYGGDVPVTTIYSAEGEIVYNTHNLIFDGNINSGVGDVNAFGPTEGAYGLNGTRIDENSKGIHIYKGMKVLR